MLTVDLHNPKLKPKTIKVASIEEVEPLLDEHKRYTIAFVIEEQRVIHTYRRSTGSWVKDPPSRP